MTTPLVTTTIETPDDYKLPIGRLFSTALRLTLFMTLVFGLIFPVLVYGAAHLISPSNAEGSLIEVNGQVVGSRLIGQDFTSDRYFYGRPSATGLGAYNAAASSGANLGVADPRLISAVEERITALQPTGENAPIPIELVTASGSGLDPHISIAAAYYQIPRIVSARNLSADAVRALVDVYTEGRQFGILGEPRVNVLELNIALDALR